MRTIGYLLAQQPWTWMVNILISRVCAAFVEEPSLLAIAAPGPGLNTAAGRRS
jgi:hypothetical protein